MWFQNRWLAYIKYECSFLQELEMACVFAIKISIYIVCALVHIYTVSLSESYLVINEWGPGSNEWKKKK